LLPVRSGGGWRPGRRELGDAPGIAGEGGGEEAEDGYREGTSGGST